MIMETGKQSVSAVIVMMNNNKPSNIGFHILLKGTSWWSINTGKDELRLRTTVSACLLFLHYPGGPGPPVPKVQRSTPLHWFFGRTLINVYMYALAGSTAINTWMYLLVATPVLKQDMVRRVRLLVLLWYLRIFGSCLICTKSRNGFPLYLFLSVSTSTIIDPIPRHWVMVSFKLPFYSYNDAFQPRVSSRLKESAY